MLMLHKFFYWKAYLGGGTFSNDLEWVYDKLKEKVAETTDIKDTSLIGASCDLLVRLMIEPSTFDNEYLDGTLLLPVNRFESKKIAWFSNDFRTDTTENAEGTYYSVSEHIVRSLEIVHLHLFLL